MKSRYCVLAAIFASVAITVILINSITPAQSPDRGNQRMELRGMVTPYADKSWADLTFTLKVDDDTLIKARPIYQKYRDNLENVVTAIREPGNVGALYGLLKAGRDEFMAELQMVLTESEITELKALEKQRVRRMFQADDQ